VTSKLAHFCSGREPHYGLHMKRLIGHEPRRAPRAAKSAAGPAAGSVTERNRVQRQEGGMELLLGSLLF
ncbi:MAG: hypothetical protein ACPIOQ_36800, partial [Promethearchaeia archaeon]